MNEKIRNIAVLGSTGSIGTQALAVAARHADRFHVAALTAHHNAEMLFDQVRAFRPKMAGLVVPPREIPNDVKFCDWVFGDACLEAAASHPDADDALVAVVGVAGLPAVLSAIAAKKRVLLANKEALVAGGALVTEAARAAGVPLIPVDSEHSAIFQCLRAADGNAPTRLILTASGGPFRAWLAEDIENATVEQALRHPNWAMGQKITIDSATMLNKALEVIEARWLFDMQPEKIDVLIHPESIVHSMVEFADGAVLAQCGVPDMRLPILYAMSYPDRLSTGAPPLDLAKTGRLTFEEPDRAKFPGLFLAYGALRAGGTACAALNAANETAVGAFLSGRMPFGRIARVVRETLERADNRAVRSLQDILDADAQARRIADALLS